MDMVSNLVEICTLEERWRRQNARSKTLTERQTGEDFVELARWGKSYKPRLHSVRMDAPDFTRLHRRLDSHFLRQLEQASSWSINRTFDGPAHKSCLPGEVDSSCYNVRGSLYLPEFAIIVLTNLSKQTFALDACDLWLDNRTSCLG